MTGTEQITNGGFEAGNSTGWMTSGNTLVDPYYAHSGTYGIYLYSGAEISQTLNATLSTITTLGFWAKGTQQYKLTFSDGSTIQSNVDNGNDYEYVDLMSVIAAKNQSLRLTKIQITSPSIGCFIDDITCIGNAYVPPSTCPVCGDSHIETQPGGKVFCMSCGYRFN